MYSENDYSWIVAFITLIYNNCAVSNNKIIQSTLFASTMYINSYNTVVEKGKNLLRLYK